MSIEEKLSKLKNQLKAAVENEQKLSAQLKAGQQMGTHVTGDSRWQQWRQNNDRKRLEGKIAKAKSEQKNLQAKIQKIVARQDTPKTPTIEKIRLGVDAFNNTAAAAKFVIGLGSAHAHINPADFNPPQPSLEDTVESNVQAKRTPLAKQKSTAKSQDKAIRKKDASPRRKNSVAKKTAQTEKDLIKAYQKDVRKNYLSTKDIHKAIDAADKNLLIKLHPNEKKEKKPDVKEDVKKKFGEDAAKAFDDARQQEIEKRKRQEQEAEQQRKRDQSRTI